MKRKMVAVLLCGLVSTCNMVCYVQAENNSSANATDKLLFRQYVDCTELDLKYYFENEYDSDGRLCERKECAENGNLNNRTEYIYDENGYLVTANTYSPSGKITSKITYENDSDGKILCEKIEENDELAERNYEYDADGNLLKKTYSSSDSESSWIYTYENGRISQVDYVSDDDQYVWAYYKYDNDGNVISTIGEGSSGDIYEYDEDGLKVKETYYIRGDQYMVSTFEYCSLDSMEEEISDTDIVYKVQEELNERGFNCGSPDGISGSATQKAIVEFMESIGKESSGKINKALLSELGIDSESGFPEENDAPFVAKGTTSLTNFLIKTSENGCSLENPKNTGTYIYVSGVYNNSIYDVRYFVENQHVYSVSIKAKTTEMLTDSGWQGCVTALAKSLNSSLDNSEITECMNNAINNMDSQIVKNNTLFRFDSENMEMTISY